ncbi:hypothetical protein D9757_011883 [Collybiopsis confluens]|uniref:Cytochrome P450 n=1 Tax=Collybiopsis confluens TaxID=2823264 RepID=A0A8H5GKV9_9AGAR|nr:hypothetical protein D9757_011883 [Collybiopsis confluens]
MSSLIFCITGLALVLAGIVFFRRRQPLFFLRGPIPASYLLGHEYELNQQADVGNLEFAWAKEYGPTFRLSGCFSESVLMIADPLGLQHILQSPNYPKPRDIRLIAERVFGRGILWATGEAHQRHKRALNPAFSPQEIKHFVPQFQEATEQLVHKWHEQLYHVDMVQLNMAEWIPKVTLDVIGRSAFDFNFGLLDDTAQYNNLYITMRDMFLDSTSPSAMTVLYAAVRRRFPERFGFKMYTTKEDRRLSSFLKAAQDAATTILKRKTEAPNVSTHDDKDILSTLVRSAANGDPKKRLGEDEIVSGISTIILAGNHTSASTFTFMLYELALHPDTQARVYREIAGLRSRIEQGTLLTSAHYDSMPYFVAVVKETLRLHPILPTIIREASHDDSIPLSIALKDKTGRSMSHIPIFEGQRILIPFSVYNRLTQVWGEDAHVWNPDRFFTQKKDVNVGVYGNLATFSGGVRSCLGWQFAILELQVMLFALLESFEFSLPPEGLDIQRIPSILMTPMIRGRLELGTQMPLYVRHRTRGLMKEKETDILE